MKTLYSVLGVSEDATDAEILRAYKKARSRTHPDKGGDKRDFEEVLLAFKVLSDPDERAEYDRSGKIPNEQEDLFQRAMEKMLIDGFASMCMGPVNDMEKHTDFDIVTHCRETIKREIKGRKESIRHKIKVFRIFRGLVTSVKGASEDNLLIAAFKREQVVLRMIVSRDLMHLRLARKALEQVKDLTQEGVVVPEKKEEPKPSILSMASLMDEIFNGKGYKK